MDVNLTPLMTAYMVHGTPLVPTTQTLGDAPPQCSPCTVRKERATPSTLTESQSDLRQTPSLLRTSSGAPSHPPNSGNRRPENMEHSPQPRPVTREQQHGCRVSVTPQSDPHPDPSTSSSGLCGSPGRHRQAWNGLDSRDIPGAVLTPSGDSQNQLLQERSAAAPQQGSGAGGRERERRGWGGREGG